MLRHALRTVFTVCHWHSWIAVRGSQVCARNVCVTLAISSSPWRIEMTLMPSLKISSRRTSTTQWSGVRIGRHRWSWRGTKRTDIPCSKFPTPLPTEGPLHMRFKACAPTHPSCTTPKPYTSTNALVLALISTSTSTRPHCPPRTLCTWGW